MTGATVAIGAIAAAAIGGGAAIIAANESSNAITGAANTAANAQTNALNQEATLSAPYRALGQAAIPELQALTGPGGNQNAALANTPGYQFSKTQGMESVTNAASAMGLGLSGNTLEGLDKFTSGLAQNTWQSEVQDLTQQVALGQGAAAGQAANTQSAAVNQGNIAIGAGNSIAGIDANLMAAISSNLGGAINTGVTANTLANLLKTPGSAPGGATDPGMQPG